MESSTPSPEASVADTLPYPKVPQDIGTGGDVGGRAIHRTKREAKAREISGFHMHSSNLRRRRKRLQYIPAKVTIDESIIGE